MTATTITLGIGYASDIATANQATGGSSFKSGEPLSFAKAFVNHFNKTGGICGRKIVPVYIDTKVVTGANKATEDQKICTQVTQDHKVFAVNSLTAGFSPDLITCLHKAGVVGVDVSRLLNLDEQVMRANFDHLYQPFAFTYDRFFPAYVNRIVADGYFDKGAKVGLVYTDIPAEKRAVQKILIPALKAKGVTVSEQAQVSAVVDADSLARSTNETNQAVLRFQTANITHVISPVAPPLLFAMRAEQQNYRPRYTTSYSAAGRGGGDAGQEGNLGQNVQWNRAIVVSWGPMLSFAEGMAAPGAKACMDILRQEKHRLPTDARATDQAFTTCDFLTFLRSALSRAADLTSAGMSSAVPALGLQQNSLSFGWRMPAGRHDGGAILRDATYSGGANGTWRYFTPPANLG